MGAEYRHIAQIGEHFFGHSLPDIRAMDARGLFSRCPRLVQSMPEACSLIAHRMFTGCSSFVQRMNNYWTDFS